MTTLSTHVLDAALGLPAAGLALTLHEAHGRQTAASTDTDGRFRFAHDLAAGTHRIVLETGAWFAAAGRDTFFPEVTVAFVVEPGREHCHVALLLSPYSYTTYRGS